MEKLVISKDKGNNAFVACVTLKGTKYALSKARQVLHETEGSPDAHRKNPDRKVGATQNFSSKDIETLTGKAIHRRLNRIERVTLSFHGKITRRTSAGLLIAFETCNDAVLATCEIQRRCASLPQIAESRLFVSVGIHKALPEMPSANPDKQPDRRNPRRRFGFDIAGQLANMAENDSIAISDLVREMLDPQFKDFCLPLPESPAGTPSYSLDWRGLAEQNISLSSLHKQGFTEEHSKHRVILRQGIRRLELNRLYAKATIGRDPGCDILITDNFASRIHAFIEVRPEGCVIIDRSANGTNITLKNGKTIHLQGEMHLLTDSGRLSFGTPMQENSTTLEFQVIETNLLNTKKQHDPPMLE